MGQQLSHRDGPGRMELFAEFGQVGAHLCIEAEPAFLGEFQDRYGHHGLSDTACLELIGCQRGFPGVQVTDACPVGPHLPGVPDLDQYRRGTFVQHSPAELFQPGILPGRLLVVRRPGPDRTATHHRRRQQCHGQPGRHPQP